MRQRHRALTGTAKKGSRRIVVAVCAAVGAMLSIRAEQGQSRTERALAQLTPVQQYHSTLYGSFGYSYQVLDAPAASAIDVFTQRNGAVPSGDPLADLVCAGDAIARGVVLGRSSHPTANGTFLFTDYEFKIAEVLKAPSETVTEGQSVILTRPGGILDMDGISFAAGHRDFPMLEIGHQYLIVGRFLPAVGSLQAAIRGGAFDCVRSVCRRLGQAVSDDEKRLMTGVSDLSLAAGLRKACGSGGEG